MAPAKPELISFNICPYVQRSVITLNEKKIDYDITYIDLANKPDWFLKISPLGKVPVLRQGEDILFESAVINEYLDEVNAPSLHPADPMQKAQNRAWIEFGGQVLMDQFGMYMAPNEETFLEKKKAATAKLQRLEEVLQDGPYFNGQEFSLIDSSLAPIFLRMEIIDRHAKLDLFAGLSKVKALADAYMQRESVQKSVVADFEELFVGFIKNRKVYLAAKL
ncbi:MAG: glutathione S-transferase family protein [Spirochaetota bacterium]